MPPSRCTSRSCTNPPGGEIFRESEDLGSDAHDVLIMDEDKNVAFHAELGDLVGDLGLIPRESTTRTRTIRLRKKDKGDAVLTPVPHTLPHPPPHAGSAGSAPSAGSNTVRGDGTMGTNPIH